MFNLNSTVKYTLLILSVALLQACGGSTTELTTIIGSSNGSVGNNTQPSVAASDKLFEDQHFAGSGLCSDCHDGMTDDQNRDISFGKAWQTSTMANAARDPYWRAKVASTLKNHPSLEHEINDTCTRCHAPMANEVMRRDNVEIKVFDDGMLNKDNAYYDHAMDGVSCSLCHQVSDTGELGSLQASSGNFVIETFSEENSAQRPAYGSYADPDAAYMIANAKFTPQHGAHMGKSEMCATCHDLKTPLLDAQGTAIATTVQEHFPEQQTFTEWKNSDYRDDGSDSATCQSCHMPTVATTAPLVSSGSGSDRRREGISEHVFLGANTVMQEMFHNYRTELGISATGFDAAIDRNREFLKTSATLHITNVRNDGDNIIANINIENHSGHKLPSGYPSRRVFIHLLVTNDSGEIVFESGKITPDGSVIGLDGDIDITAYEPHYESIDRQNQVQVYESIMANASGQVTHSLLEGTRYFKDNRLTPKGFDKAVVPTDVSVAGLASNDTNFNNGQDSLEYTIPAATTGNYHILAELVYQPLAFGHLEYLFKDIELADVDAFKTIYDTTELKSEIISSATTTHNH